jgi:hypothetical protein
MNLDSNLLTNNNMSYFPSQGKAIMDDFSHKRNFDLDKRHETITIAGKSILK